MGSEMCIRDRAGSDDRGQQQRGDGCTASEGGEGGEGFQAVLRGCLLYTSDAADDLLCVDLGGRRIIKKKQQLNHLPQHTDYEQHGYTDRTP